MTGQRRAISERSTTIATQKAVWNAADALRRQGLTPSAQRVRAHIGGGSLRTIQRHLISWRARPISPEELGPRVDIADEIAKFSKLLALHAAQLRAEAQQVAQARAKRDFESWQAETLAQVRAQVRETERARKELAAELKEVKKALESERTVRATAQDRLENAQAEYSRLLRRLADTERGLPGGEAPRARKS